MKSIHGYQILIIITVFMITASMVSGQEGSGKIKYTPEFRFNDGIYLNFDQVRENNPIPKAKILTSADYNDRDFFTRVLAAEKIYFYDDMGLRQEVEKTKIWGFSRNGVIYVMIQGTPNRITFVGNICHFVADVTTYESRNYNNYYSPYGYYDPYYYSPYSYYGGYPYGSYYGPTHSSRSELKQYIFDFETGKVLDFTVDNVKLLIMKDPAIYDEYVQLPPGRKKELMIVYIRKFNEKNPLYLPAK